MCLLYLCHKYDLGVLDYWYGMDYKFIAQIMVVSYIKYFEIHVHPETWGHYDLEPFHVAQHKEEKTENVTKASWDLRLTMFQKLIVVNFLQKSYSSSWILPAPKLQ